MKSFDEMEDAVFQTALEEMQGIDNPGNSDGFPDPLTTCMGYAVDRELSVFGEAQTSRAGLGITADWAINLLNDHPDILQFDEGALANEIRRSVEQYLYARAYTRMVDWSQEENVDIGADPHQNLVR